MGYNFENVQTYLIFKSMLFLLITNFIRFEIAYYIYPND